MRDLTIRNINVHLTRSCPITKHGFKGGSVQTICQDKVQIDIMFSKTFLVKILIDMYSSKYRDHNVAW